MRTPLVSMRMLQSAKAAPVTWRISPSPVIVSGSSFGSPCENVEGGSNGIGKLVAGDLDGVLEGGGEYDFLLVAGQALENGLDDQSGLAVFEAAVEGEVLDLRSGAGGTGGCQPGPEQQGDKQERNHAGMRGAGIQGSNGGFHYELGSGIIHRPLTFVRLPGATVTTCSAAYCRWELEGLGSMISSLQDDDRGDAAIGYCPWELNSASRLMSVSHFPAMLFACRIIHSSFFGRASAP